MYYSDRRKTGYTVTKRGFTATKQKQIKPKPIAAKKKAPFKPTQPWLLVQPAFLLYKKNFTVLTVIMTLPALVSVLGQIMAQGFLDGIATAGAVATITDVTVLGILLLIISTFWAVVTLPAVLYVLVHTAANDRPSIIDSYRKSLRFLPRLYGLILLLSILILCTAILIVPVFIIIRRYALSAFFLVDEDCGIRQAMQRSAAVSKPYRRQVWKTLFFIIILNAVSSLAVYFIKPYGGIAVVFAMPVMTLILALFYKEITTRSVLDLQGSKVPKSLMAPTIEN
jgi:hypothetical protein